MTIKGVDEVDNLAAALGHEREASLEAIGEALAENGRVIVTGCLGARANLIRENYPNVLSITGPAAYESVVQAVHDAVPQTAPPGPGAPRRSPRPSGL